MKQCTLPHEGEIIHAERTDWPLVKGTLYGTQNDAAKLAKRIRCSSGHLPIRLQFFYQHDLVIAAEQGVVQNPTFQVEGKNLIEGLIQTEEIGKILSNLVLH